MAWILRLQVFLMQRIFKLAQAGRATQKRMKPSVRLLQADLDVEEALACYVAERDDHIALVRVPHASRDIPATFQDLTD